MPPDTPPESLVPKSTLPITHAVIVMRMNEGAPQQLAAVQLRSDGHPILVGDVKACTPHFINAMKAAVRASFLEAMPAALDALAAESENSTNPPASESPSA